MNAPPKQVSRPLNQNNPIIGIDEVGRGPLAGPVVACACAIPEALKSTPEYTQIRDSKKLSAKKREMLSAWLEQHALYGIGQASVEEIDSINILQATFLAMERALASLLLSFPGEPMSAEAFAKGDAGERKGTSSTSKDPLPSVADAPSPRMTLEVLIDGNRVPKSIPNARAIIGGDGLVPEIAAASIIAKVYRDRLMYALAREFPAYGWDKNAGYGTAEHMAALKEYQPTIHHRRSFAPIRLFLKESA